MSAKTAFTGDNNSTEMAGQVPVSAQAPTNPADGVVSNDCATGATGIGAGNSTGAGGATPRDRLRAWLAEMARERLPECLRLRRRVIKQGTFAFCASKGSVLEYKVEGIRVGDFLKAVGKLPFEVNGEGVLVNAEGARLTTKEDIAVQIRTFKPLGWICDASVAMLADLLMVHPQIPRLLSLGVIAGIERWLKAGLPLNDYVEGGLRVSDGPTTFEKYKEWVEAAKKPEEADVHGQILTYLTKNFVGTKPDKHMWATAGEIPSNYDTLLSYVYAGLFLSSIGLRNSCGGNIELVDQKIAQLHAGRNKEVAIAQFIKAVLAHQILHVSEAGPEVAEIIKTFLPHYGVLYAPGDETGSRQAIVYDTRYVFVDERTNNPRPDIRPDGKACETIIAKGTVNRVPTLFVSYHVKSGVGKSERIAQLETFANLSAAVLQHFADDSSLQGIVSGGDANCFNTVTVNVTRGADTEVPTDAPAAGGHYTLTRRGVTVTIAVDDRRAGFGLHQLATELGLKSVVSKIVEAYKTRDKSFQFTKIGEEIPVIYDSCCFLFKEELLIELSNELSPIGAGYLPSPTWFTDHPMTRAMATFPANEPSSDDDTFLTNPEERDDLTIALEEEVKEWLKAVKAAKAAAEAAAKAAAEAAAVELAAPRAPEAAPEGALGAGAGNA